MNRVGYDAYSPPDPWRAKAAGYDFGMHYLGGSRDKQLTDTVRRAAHDAGVDVGLNWEVDTSDADGGYTRGQAYAAEANREADNLGAPGGTWIYYSVDSGRTADQVRPYFQGIASVHGRPAGGYGGTEMVAMLDEHLIVGWWQANAGSWSGWDTSNFPTHPRACLRQYVSGARLPAIDHNEQLADNCGLWRSPLNPAPPSTPGANLMAFGPTGTHIDLTITGVDGKPYTISADSPEALAKASWSEVGPAAVTLDILAQGWTADASKYVILAKGADNRVWVNVNRAPNWFPVEAGAVGQT